MRNEKNYTVDEKELYGRIEQMAPHFIPFKKIYWLELTFRKFIQYLSHHIQNVMNFGCSLTSGTVQKRCQIE